MNLVLYTKNFALTQGNVSTPISRVASPIKTYNVSKSPVSKEKDTYNVVSQGAETKKVYKNNLKADSRVDASIKFMNNYRNSKNRKERPTRIRSFKLPNEVTLSARYQQSLVDEAKRYKENK